MIFLKADRNGKSGRQRWRNRFKFRYRVKDIELLKVDGVLITDGYERVGNDVYPSAEAARQGWEDSAPLREQADSIRAAVREFGDEQANQLVARATRMSDRGPRSWQACFNQLVRQARLQAMTPDQERAVMGHAYGRGFIGYHGLGDAPEFKPTPEPKP